MSKEDAPSKRILSLDYGNKNLKRYISQNNYKHEMLNEVEPYLKAKLKVGYVSGVSNIKLYYEKYISENPKANIVICHGLGEFSEKYNELIYYFLKERYSVFILEHRGHGRSHKLGIDDSQVNIEKFNYYINDFKKFIDDIVVPNSHNKSLFLFAHSMGGAIGAAFLEEHTEYFKAAILSAPMFEINTGKIPKLLANAISRWMKLCGKGISYLPGQLPYRGDRKFPNRTTSCEERYDYIYEKIRDNKYYHSGGPSVFWYLESLRATKKIIKKKNASKVNIPVLLFQAELDTHVIPRAHNIFAGFARNCEIIHVKGAKHEAYFERDEIAFTFFDKILLFYESNI